MEKITLDTKITQIEGIEELWQIKHLGFSIKSFIQNEEITTLGDLLMYADYKLIRGEKAHKLLKDFIHELGFVFIDEAGYIDQLRGFIAEKYNIYNFNYQTFDNATKRKLLDFKVSELLIFFPEKIGDKASLEAKYSSKTLKELLEERNFLNNYEKARQHFTRFNLCWNNLIHELGFVFGDEEEYAEQMTDLEHAQNLGHDWNFAILKIPWEDLNYSQFLSIYTYNYFQMHDIKTILDVLTKDISKFPKICLIQLKSLFNFYNIPFIGDENFLEFKQKALRYIEVRQKSEEVFKSNILEQRYKKVSQKMLDLLNKKENLKVTNAYLERINISLESLIATLEEKNNILERKNEG